MYSSPKRCVVTKLIFTGRKSQSRKVDLGAASGYGKEDSVSQTSGASFEMMGPRKDKAAQPDLLGICKPYNCQKREHLDCQITFASRPNNGTSYVKNITMCT